jgi:hypothetical protein
MKNKINLLLMVSIVLLLLTNCSDKEINKKIQFEDFYHVDANRFIILADSAASNLRTGDLTLIDDDYGYATVLANIKSSFIPEKFQSFIGKEFIIYNAKNEKISVTIKSIKLMVKYYPHSGQVQEWTGEYSGNPPMSLKQKTQNIWKERAPFLVAEFEPSNKIKSKEKFLFALPKSTNEIDLIQDGSDKITNELSKQVENIIDIESPWFNNISGKESLTLFYKNAKTSYIAVTRETGEVCSGEHKTSFFLVKSNGSKNEIEIALDEQYNAIAMFDIEGDNSPEFLLTDGIGGSFVLHKTKKGWELDNNFIIPYFDCGC